MSTSLGEGRHWIQNLESLSQSDVIFNILLVNPFPTPGLIFISFLLSLDKVISVEKGVGNCRPFMQPCPDQRPDASADPTSLKNGAAFLYAGISLSKSFRLYLESSCRQGPFLDIKPTKQKINLSTHCLQNTSVEQLYSNQRPITV